MAKELSLNSNNTDTSSLTTEKYNIIPPNFVSNSVENQENENTLDKSMGTVDRALKEQMPNQANKPNEQYVKYLQLVNQLSSEIPFLKAKKSILGTDCSNKELFNGSGSIELNDDLTKEKLYSSNEFQINKLVNYKNEILEKEEIISSLKNDYEVLLKEINEMKVTVTEYEKNKQYNISKINQMNSTNDKLTNEIAYLKSQENIQLKKISELENILNNKQTNEIDTNSEKESDCLNLSSKEKIKNKELEEKENATNSTQDLIKSNMLDIKKLSDKNSCLKTQLEAMRELNEQSKQQIEFKTMALDEANEKLTKEKEAKILLAENLEKNTIELNYLHDQTKKEKQIIIDNLKNDLYTSQNKFELLNENFNATTITLKDLENKYYKLQEFTQTEQHKFNKWEKTIQENLNDRIHKINMDYNHQLSIQKEEYQSCIENLKRTIDETMARNLHLESINNILKQELETSTNAENSSTSYIQKQSNKLKLLHNQWSKAEEILEQNKLKHSEEISQLCTEHNGVISELKHDLLEMQCKNTKLQNDIVDQKQKSKKDAELIVEIKSQLKDAEHAYQIQLSKLQKEIVEQNDAFSQKNIRTEELIEKTQQADHKISRLEKENKTYMHQIKMEKTRMEELNKSYKLQKNKAETFYHQLQILRREMESIQASQQTTLRSIPQFQHNSSLMNDKANFKSAINLCHVNDIKLSPPTPLLYKCLPSVNTISPSPLIPISKRNRESHSLKTNDLDKRSSQISDKPAIYNLSLPPDMTIVENTKVTTKYIAYSGFNNILLFDKLQKLISNITFIDCLSNKALPGHVTHLVSSGVITIKLLAAILSGCWILPESFLKECLKQERWVDEKNQWCRKNRFTLQSHF